jgi:serine/threonine-protein kinase
MQMDEGGLIAAPSDPRIGKVVKERYRIVRKLGEGGMGAVYEAEHLVIKRRVAIKCLHANFAANEGVVKRFHNEALAATAIGHPSIVDILDMDRFDDGSVFMVLEYLEGQDLAHLLKDQGAQPLPRMVHIMAQVCEALAAAHDKGIVHRDLKPDNIFLIRRGEDPDFVKVLDFGIAKFADLGNKGMTRTGTVMGTPHYMAPEQAQGATHQIDQRADIYSLGVILFNTLTGVLPFDDESFPMLVVKICTQPVPPLTAYRPDLPPDLEALVTRMMSKNPAERPADCRAVKEHLLRYAAAPSSVTLSTETPKIVPGTLALFPSSPTAPSSPMMAQAAVQVAPPKKKGLVIALGIVGALVVLGAVGTVAAVVASQGRDDAPRPPPVLQPVTPPATKVDPVPTPPVAPPVTPPVAPADPTKTVRVQIEVIPHDAELSMDGHRIANPFDADLPQSDVPRRLEAKLASYQTVVQELSLSFPQRVKIELKRGAGVDDRRVAGAKTTGPAVTPVPPTTPPEPVTPPATEPVKTQPSEPTAPPPSKNELKRITIP